MKTVRSIVILTLSVFVLVANEKLVFAQKGTNERKTPRYLDCYPDKVMIQPGNITITWEALQKPGNPVEQLLDEVQAHKQSEYILVLARPNSVKFFRAIRRMAGMHPIDISCEVADVDYKFDLKNPPSPHTPAVPSFIPEGKSVFFECRNGEVFCIDEDGLEVQAAKLLSTVNSGVGSSDMIAFSKVVNGAEVGNEYYKVLPAYLLMHVVALEPRPNVHGDPLEQLALPTSKFQAFLHTIDPRMRKAIFLVRSDSFAAFRAARALAENRKFDTGWELLSTDEPIKFGTGSSVGKGQ